MVSRINLRAILWATPLLVLPLVTADEAGSPKPSQYAPIQDVVAQIEAFLQQLGTDLSAEADYGDDQKSRVAKDANTLIVLAQILATHNEKHDRQKSAAPLLSASQGLANSTEKFADAKSALEKVNAAWKSDSGGEVKREPVANLQLLMKQVPIVNNKLRSGVSGRRFDRTIDQNAGLATTLAAIAEASSVDTDYCTGKDEEARWAKICAEMRDAAASINAAVRKKDQKAATAGLERLVKTCDDCHHDFRD